MRSEGVSAPTVCLGALYLIASLGEAVSSAFSMPLGGGFRLLYYIGVSWALAWWVVADCRIRGIPTSIDHGWFVFSFSLIAFPYHLIRTRGGRGCLVIAGMIGMFLAAYAVGIGVYFVLR